ncbi:MAG: ABC transporter substrate-binding protein [Methanimicrococcus sp.]|nr:ABC transporter substrate-binding protein [Methanimicrococcus sp.]
MKKMTRTIIALFVIAEMLLIPAAGVQDTTDFGAMDFSAADFGAADFTPVTVVNSVGTAVTFEEPAQKAASLGISFTTTLLALECGDSIVLIDQYSSDSNSGITELASHPASSHSYPVGNGEQIAQLLADGMGGFDKTRDVVFIYGYAYHADAIRSMEALGLKVVTFYPATYSEGVEMVTEIGAIMGKNSKAAEITQEMKSASAYYSQTLEENGIAGDSRVKAVYVSYSGGNMRIGNINSYSVILLKIAGGVNPADDANMIGSALISYGIDDTALIQLDPDVIFLDPNYSGTAEEFRAEKNLKDSVRVYKLSMIMNQYGPSSMDGIEYMAKAMYPDIFGYLDDEQAADKAGNTLLYVLAVCAFLAIAAIAYTALRR